MRTVNIETVDGVITFSIEGKDTLIGKSPNHVLKTFTNSEYVHITLQIPKVDEFRIHPTEDSITIEGVLFSGDKNDLADEIGDVIISEEVPEAPFTGNGELISVEGQIQWDDRPYEVTPTEVTFDRNVIAPNSTIGLGGGKEAGATNEVMVLTNTFDDSFSYVPEAKIIGRLSDGVSYVKPFQTYEKTDPQGQAQPNQTTTISSTQFFDNITKTNRYYQIVAIPAALGDIITYMWYLRSPTGFVNGNLRAFKGIVTDPNSLDFVWSTSTKNVIRINAGQPAGGSNTLINEAAAVLTDIEIPLLKDGFYQKDGDTLSFLLTCDNPYILEAGLLPDGGGGFFVYPYILTDGVFWKDTFLADREKVIGKTLETLISSESTAATQEPNALDTPIQIEFGTLQVTPQVELHTVGTVLFKEKDLYRVSVHAQYGAPQGGGGQASLRFRLELNGAPFGDVFSATVNDSKVSIPLIADFFINANEDDEIKAYLLRDSSQNNKGGLFRETTALAGWDDSPSASISIQRFVYTV